MLTSVNTPLEQGLEILKKTVIPGNMAEVVSCKESWKYETEETKYHIAAVDFGIKHSILKAWKKRGCYVTIVPWNTSAEEIRKLPLERKTPSG